MPSNYLKIALRNFIKYKMYSIISIGGLAIGFMSCFLILLYILHEFSYDRFHENADRIYRVVNIDESTGRGSAPTPFILGEKLAGVFPEIEQLIRIQHGSKMISINGGETCFEEKNFVIADKDIFNIFTIPLVYGDKKSVLENPNSVVIDQDIAKKYFGNSDPIGKTVAIQFNSDFNDLIVTGVFAKMPSNSHFKAELIAPMDVFIKECQNVSWEMFGNTMNFLDYWGAATVGTYVLLSPSSSSTLLDEKLPDFFKQHVPNGFAYNYQLQPLKHIHLSRTITGHDLDSHGDLNKIVLLAGIALIILLIACINFIILTTARSSIRTLEIGIRKVMGAHRTDLMKQSILESLCVAFISLPLAMILVEIFLPVFNQFVVRDMSIHYFQNWPLLLSMILVTSLVGVISGGYIAFHVSKFNPITILQKYFSLRVSKSLVRQGLIVSQVMIFIILIFCTITIYRQMYFFQNKDLGFKKDNLLYFDIFEDRILKSYNGFETKIKQHPNILHASGGFCAPFSGAPADISIQVGVDPKDQKKIGNVLVDYGYFETLGIELVQGRFFSEQHTMDATESIIVNETLVRELSLNDPLDHVIRAGEQQGHIIGVVKDCHMQSLHKAIGPCLYKIIPPQYTWKKIIRIRPENTTQTIEFLTTEMKKLFPDMFLEIKYADEILKAQYLSEKKLKKIMTYATFIAIFVASLGLFGLASFLTNQRTKEIGIRKVLGASVAKIIALLSKEFVKWVLLANLIAWPIAYFTMNRWLQNFAYRIDVGWWTFVLTGVLALAIALLTVSYQAIRAAMANPVEALRYE